MADGVGGFEPPAEETLAEVLREIRNALGLSQGAMAERTVLSLRGYSDIERGRTLYPHRATLERICEKLGLSAEDRARLIRASTQPPRQVSQSYDHSAGADVPTPAVGQSSVAPQQLGHSWRHWLWRRRASSVKPSLHIAA